MIRCSSCGAVNRQGAKFCVNCGVQFAVVSQSRGVWICPIHYISIPVGQRCPQCDIISKK